MTEINILGIETSRGYRTVRLLHGSIADVSADLRIVSTHANQALAPSGRALDALGLSALGDDDLEPLLLLRPASVLGTWRVSHADPPVLVLRIPAATAAGDDENEQLGLYEKGVWAVFSSLAALELHGEAFPVVGSVFVGGRRHYPTVAAMSVLLDHAVRWLERSRTTFRVDIVEHDASKVSLWSQAMDQALGRSAHDLATNKVVAALSPDDDATLDRGEV